MTSETTFSNYLLIVHALSKSLKLYGMEIFTTEQVMDKLDMFQSRFGKIDKFGWWDLEKISRCRYSTYLHGVTGLMSNPQCSFDISSSGISGNEVTS